MLQVDLGGFDQPGAIRRFALKMSFKAVILSSLVTIAGLPLLHFVGLLPVSLVEAVQLAVLFCWLFGGVVSGILALLTGYVLRELTLSRREFERLSLTDVMSDLANRRAFNLALRDVDENCSLVIVDIDRFKAINDGYGHQAGDGVIRGVAAILREIFGADHLVARLGGEEFGLILRGGGAAQRIAQVERARTIIAARGVSHDGVVIGVTISAGLADFLPGRSSEYVYSLADQALYVAKTGGRNRVVHEADIGDELSGLHDEAVSTRPVFGARSLGC
ncbi:GGDEF domain-containing protein [Peteryoungia desertarenae]|uniref:diguanylate cyclase n=1 Tax=Peteryoungia desertarenae TaxID=1813451 RepID=A0ABX6QS38_9HYPH|nr:GGDEF domain-containing protein [Peteryoungia desertarenae]QLF71086.1 GGDEF domain-containing protein [Peteryoungia desertarenae]